MKKIALFLIALSLFTSAAEAETTMPPPRAMPRAPVSRENIVTPHEAIPASREMQGPAAIIDGERLRIGETDLRLFGIVPPQLSASFGPQARSALDQLAGGQSVNCAIRDRDRDGRLLATCRNAAGADMALELLKRGLAVTARGSIAGTELSQNYLAAEQAAQNAKLGLWSTLTPAAAAVPKIEAPAPVEETKKEDKPAPRAESRETPAQAKIAADILAQQQARIDEAVWPQNDDEGFFERYQILIAGFLMLATALSISGVLWAQKSREQREELKALAAALRGELMAARSVCLGRAKSIAGEAEDKAASWPRIRASLYQAYVGRLGLLGADLARQVASIYGQSGDYTALYSPASPSHEAPKKQALETLAKYIDAVLPKLAYIENIGQIPATPAYKPAAGLQYSNVPRPARPAAQPQPALPSAPVEMETAATEPVAASEPVPAPQAQAPVAKASSLTPVTLWENVRGFLQNHRNAVAAEHHEATEAHMSDYAAMIEADMARYQYGENIESLDLAPKKKQG